MAFLSVMGRVAVELLLAEGMPSPLGIRGAASLFGVWLRERIMSIAIDWPAVGFHRVELLPDGVRLVLIGPRGVPPAAAATAIARAIRGEVHAKLLSCYGLAEGWAVFEPESGRTAESD